MATYLIYLLNVNRKILKYFDMNINNQFDEDDLLVEEEQDEDSTSINYDIATYPSDFTLSGITQMWKDKDITIPDFQREFVWSDASSITPYRFLFVWVASSSSFFLHR